MDRQLTTLVAGWLAVFGAMGFICGDGGADGGPTGNCEQDPALKPEEVDEGDLDVLLGETSYRRSPPPDTTAGRDTADDRAPGQRRDTAGRDTADDPDVSERRDTVNPGDTTGNRDTGERRDADDDAADTDDPRDVGPVRDVDETGHADEDRDAGEADVGSSTTDYFFVGDVYFSVLDEDFPSLDVIGGAQGGFHAEPAVLVRGMSARDNATLIRMQIRDGETGDVLTHRACEKSDSGDPGISWTEEGDRSLFHGMRVIFDSPARSEVVNHTHELVVDLQIGDKRKVIRRDIRFDQF